MSFEEQIQVNIPLDEDGMIGRECLECEGYFKLKPGTGLSTTYCHCPYCDYEGEGDTFWTKEQIEYALSIAVNEFINNTVKPSLEKMFKDLERKTKRSLIQFQYKSSNKTDFFPIQYYSEKELETNVKCDNCGLEFSIYGVFATCPDCNEINAFLIYKESLKVTEKKLNIFLKPEIPESVREDSLKHILTDCISSFDALGKELRKKKPELFSNKSKNLFQKINLLNSLLDNYIKRDIDDFGFICKMFQVRHLYEHNMGVIDDYFIKYVDGYGNKVGMKYELTSEELRKFIMVMKKLGQVIKKYYNLSD